MSSVTLRRSFIVSGRGGRLQTTSCQWMARPTRLGHRRLSARASRAACGWVVLSLLVNAPVLLARPPNLILVLADDLGYECLSVNGSDSYRTPYLDRLAEQGARFTECHVLPLCTPTRVEILTGLYGVRHYTQFGKIHPDVPTIAQRLKAAGYATAAVGKWQLGHDPDLPRRLGFDEYYLWQHTRRPPRYANPGLELNGIQQDFNSGEYGPDLLNAYAREFVSKRRAEPFFLYYPMLLVHAPFQPPPNHPDWDPTARGEEQSNPTYFKAMVEYMDQLVGRLVDTVDRDGLATNTVIIFLADNGTSGSIATQWNGQLYRGGKGQTTRRGTHVPLIVRWTGSIAPGQVISSLVGAVDVPASLLDFAGVQPNPSDPLDGRSFGPLLLTGRAQPPRDVLYTWYCPRPGQTALREWAVTTEWKLYASGELYRWCEDFDEQRPVSREQLDPPTRRCIQRLEEELHRWREIHRPEVPTQSKEPRNRKGGRT